MCKRGRIDAGAWTWFIIAFGVMAAFIISQHGKSHRGTQAAIPQMIAAMPQLSLRERYIQGEVEARASVPNRTCQLFPKGDRGYYGIFLGSSESLKAGSTISFFIDSQREPGFGEMDPYFDFLTDDGIFEVARAGYRAPAIQFADREIDQVDLRILKKVALTAQK